MLAATTVELDLSLVSSEGGGEIIAHLQRNKCKVSLKELPLKLSTLLLYCNLSRDTIRWVQTLLDPVAKSLEDKVPRYTVHVLRRISAVWWCF